MFLPIMELVVAGLVVWVAITQVLIPIFRGTPLFSAIQKQGIEAKLESARQELRIAELEREIAAIKRREQEVRLASLNDELDRFTEDSIRPAQEKGQSSVIPRRFEQ
jgi:hypothetical protein